MRRTLASLSILLFLGSVLYAQTTDPSPSDDMPFVFVFVVITLSVMTGAVIVGAVAMGILLLCIFGLVMAGVLSASIFIGLYRRSLKAVFRSLLLNSCALGGIVTGIFGLWVIDRLFRLHISTSTIAWTGLIGGLAGGILLGITLLTIIRVLMQYAQKRLGQ